MVKNFQRQMPTFKRGIFMPRVIYRASVGLIFIEPEVVVNHYPSLWLHRELLLQASESNHCATRRSRLVG